MFLTVSNVSKTYGAATVLKDISFVVNPGQRVGLVGANGSGKTTLLKIIVGEVEPDAGAVRIPRGLQVGYLPQTMADAGTRGVNDLLMDGLGNLRQLQARISSLEEKIHHAQGPDLDACMAEYGAAADEFERRGGFELDSRLRRVTAGLGIEHIPRERAVSTLSGGEKARLGLAVLLLQAPDLLLLDEPTNHLDFFALGWLESFLLRQGGALLVVSHDRQFLNRIVDTVVEIDEHSHTSKQYRGDYDAYLAAKRAERKRWEQEYAAQQEELGSLRQALKARARKVGHNRPPRDGDKVAYDFFGGRVQNTISRNLRSLEEKIARLEADPIPRPPEVLRLDPDFDPQALAGKFALVASGVSKTYAGNPVLRAVHLALAANSHVVLVGPNGAGKSTLLKILAGLERPDDGDVILTPTARIGYLDQELASLDLSRKVLDTYREGLEGPQEKLTGELIRFGLFRYADVLKRVGELSLGQRRKLQVARLVALRANLLLLDEPTNHLSLDVLEEFEAALVAFPGPVLAISHDRRLIARFAREVWELRAGSLSLYPLGPAEYLAAQVEHPHYAK